MVNEFFLMWLVMASVQFAATLSPGPAFVVSVRHAVRYSRRSGIFTAAGLALGVGVHVCLVLVGLAVVIMQSAYLYAFIKYAGAAYLIYIGIRALMTKEAHNVPDVPDVSDLAQNGEGDRAAAQVCDISGRKALMIGFFTNVLNPKAVVFFTAVFTQFISPDTPFFMIAAYGVTSVMIEFLWFSGVAVVLTNARIRRRFMRFMQKIERACGGLMIVFGIKLAFMR